MGPLDYLALRLVRRFMDAIEGAGETVLGRRILILSGDEDRDVVTQVLLRASL